MSERDIFLVRAGGESLFSACAGYLLEQGAVDRMVLALAEDVPEAIITSLRQDGFDLIMDGSRTPQGRIRHAMEQLNLSEALVLNGYSFLVDADIVGRLAEQRDAGCDLAAFLSKTPFRYAALLSLEACREIEATEASPLPPNRLHCYQRQYASQLSSCLLRAEAEFSPIDDCFWLLALNTLHGGSDRLLANMIHAVRKGVTPTEALHRVLEEQNIHIPALAERYGAKTVHHYFKYRREVAYTWVKQMDSVLERGGNFLEVGCGCSPYPSRLFARYFARGLCFDPYEPKNSPLFMDQLAIAGELDQKLEPFIFSGDSRPGHIDYRQCSLHELNLPSASVDFCYSSSVLEHVQDLETMAIELRRIMRPGSLMLHAVDFTAHGHCSDEDTYPFYAHPKEWWFANKPQGLNLHRVSDVFQIFTQTGFQVMVVQRNLDSRLPAVLHEDWKGYSREDLICAGAFLHCTVRN